jgi:hypothetical protein
MGRRDRHPELKDRPPRLIVVCDRVKPQDLQQRLAEPEPSRSALRLKFPPQSRKSSSVSLFDQGSESERRSR